MRSSSGLCLLCRFNTIALSRKPQSIHSSWQQVRSVVQVQRRKPSRMELSPRVSQPSPRASPSGKQSRRRQDGPFGGMNRTEARVHVRPSPLGKQSRGRQDSPFKGMNHTESGINVRPSPSGKPPRGGQDGPFSGTNRTEAGVNVRPTWNVGPTKFGVKPSPLGKQSRRGQDGPFGAMNRTEARVDVRPTRSVGSTKFGMKPKTLTKGKPPNKSKKTEGVFKALKMQRALSSIPYDRRATVKSSITEIDSFDQFGLLPIIQGSILSQGLTGMEQISPTPIQRLAIPALLGTDKEGKSRSRRRTKGMEQFLLAAETGSGKTLAYLLPVIDAIKRAESEGKLDDERNKLAEKPENRKKRNVFELDPPVVTNEPQDSSGRPRVIILLPTAELVGQVGKVFKSFSHTVKFRASMISAADSGIVIRSRTFAPSGVDVLISTPHLLGSIAEGDPNILSRVTHLVIDEADSLLDRSFSPLTSAVIDKATPSLQKLILCSATIPQALDTHLRKRFPDIRRLATPNLHAIPRRVQLGVVDVAKEPYRGNKDLACADTIWTIGRGISEHDTESAEREITKRIIVFVNERNKTGELAEYLISKGIDAVGLNRDTSEARRSEILATFTSSKPPQAGSAARETQPTASDRRSGKRTLPNTKVLVITDLGSRGIDTLAVRHVVLYDVPHTTIDFIHRLGRTGRMGRRGRGIVLVGNHDRRDIVREVRESMYMGKALI